MGPRWKGREAEAKAIAEPMSKTMSQLHSCLSDSDACGLLNGGAVLVAATQGEQTEFLIRACFGRPIVNAEKDKQWFRLGLEEAFYLCFSLKCLKILGEDGHVKCDIELWAYMKLKRVDFPVFYKAYYHLRSKHWVVRDGLQYGVDFVVYRHHPSLVHSEYAVVVLMDGDGDVNNGRLRVWSDLHCTIRLCGSVAKSLLVLSVNKNGHGDESPSCLEDYSIQEYTIRRWSPEQSREVKSSHQSGRK